MPRDTFHQELREIEESVITMATMVESEIARAMQALTQRDVALAEGVVTSDGEVNEMQRTIRSRCINVIALQAPVARDLRELITVQLVINELERMGDHAVGISKQTLRIRDYETSPIAYELSELAKLVREQVRACIQAFVDVNVQQAREICVKDDEVDQQYRTIFNEVLGLMTRDSASVPVATSLLFIAHDLERIGDRVTNICEDVIYMVSGQIEELN
ncbi:MAG TPA: phosphate signaling complex protein PhoU [Ktedonobacterales bacterium]|nr:phosphate signaling complex protein PhoU [Ktedonobacterales bacterium]